MEGSGQILQQIEGLLAQLAQNEPAPEVQQEIQKIQAAVEPLQQMMGAQDAQNMQSGLANPSGGGGMPPSGIEEPGAAGGAMPADAAALGGEDQGAPPAGGDHHGVAEIHIKMAPGGPKGFGAAKKAAMAQHASSGHFDPHTAKGESPSTDRTKNKGKG